MNMNTVPKMTKIQAHFEDSNLELNLNKDADGHYLNEVARYAWMNWMTAYSFGREHQANIANKAIEIALAEQTQQETYITAAQARELGVGNAEYSIDPAVWHTCWQGCEYLDTFNGAKFKYRATPKQAQPEPVDPHAALRAEYAKQVADGTRKFYQWETQGGLEHSYRSITYPNFFPDSKYRCTDISCMVALKGETAKRMLRTEAQELQRSLGDTVEWFLPSGLPDKFVLFKREGTYTYAPKATIKLDGKMVTPEQAADEWEAKKETCDLWYTNRYGNPECLSLMSDEPRWYDHKELGTQYELRPKAVKQVKWEDMPAGIAVTYRGQTYPMHRSPVMGYPCVITTDGLICQDFSNSNLDLAPASEQKYIVGDASQIDKMEKLGLKFSWRDCDNRMGDGIIIFKITGIAKGYVLEGAV
jgi:hypothetical protein